MNKFKDMEDLEQFIEENCYTVTRDPEQCYVCGRYLTGTDGWSEHHACDAYLPDEKFCSEDCIKEVLINNIGFEEEDNE